ncbi:hypothetical protein CBF34_06350 [Vagococcus penaei]|nr:hypothetical protein CBF34_06350 [Vagococcus penaei]
MVFLTQLNNEGDDVTLNRNTIWTIFIFLAVLNSPLLFQVLGQTRNIVLNGTALTYLVGATVLIWLYKKSSKQGTLSESKKQVSRMKIIVVGVSGIFLSLILQGVLTQLDSQLFNQPIESQNTQTIMALVKQAPLYIIAVSIAGPIMEELVFRFSLTNWLGQRMPIWLAAGISSFLFAIMHNDGHWLVYGGLGLLFFIIYQRTNSIWSAIITHAGMNTLVVCLQLFS